MAVKKGERKMSAQSKFGRTVISAFAALLISSVAVGSAVAPAQVGPVAPGASIRA